METPGKLTRRRFLAGAASLYAAMRPSTAEPSHLWHCPSHKCQYIVEHKQPDFKSDISELEEKLQDASVKTFTGELRTVYGKGDMLIEAMLTKEGNVAAYFVFNVNAYNEKTQLKMAVVPRQDELPVVYDYWDNFSKNTKDWADFWKNPENIKSKHVDNDYVYLEEIEKLFKKHYPEYNKELPKRRPMPIILRGELLVKK